MGCLLGGGGQITHSRTRKKKKKKNSRKSRKSTTEITRSDAFGGLGELQHVGGGV